MVEPDADFDSYAVRAADSALLTANDRSFTDFQTPCMWKQNRAARQRSSFLSAERARFFLQIGAHSPRGGSEKK